MDVRKWLTDKLTEMRFLGEYGSTESLPSDYTATITREVAPAITKLVEALRRFRDRDHTAGPQAAHECEEQAKAALAELEKP